MQKKHPINGVLFLYPNRAAGPRRFEVSPAGSVGAPHFVRVVHRTTAPRLALIIGFVKWDGLCYYELQKGFSLEETDKSKFVEETNEYTTFME
jgi:hypothetical protein